ncbi:hypothetical protein [Chitinolyticbacter meiyuanensis]|uniref:hypothetical protein n=1 Tax=Chitinolyticbacter meiyuanensis TaxID=682798 RepID=UPI0011E5DF1D|nr:hypothetical protein [Chitinolyticbacter meiyuanensis]
MLFKAAKVGLLCTWHRLCAMRAGEESSKPGKFTGSRNGERKPFSDQSLAVLRIRRAIHEWPYWSMKARAQTAIFMPLA